MALTVSAAYGRLDETVAQCKDRYGEPLRSDSCGCGDVPEPYDAEPRQVADKHLRYKKDSIDVYIGFVGGKAVSIAYVLADNDHLTRDKIERLLALNAPAQKWFFHFDDNDAELEKTRGVFWSEDGRYYAEFDGAGRRLWIARSGLRPTFAARKPDNSLLEGF